MNINQSQRCSSKPIKKQLFADFNEFADCFGFLSGPSYSHGGHIVLRDLKKALFYHPRPRGEKLGSEAGQVKENYFTSLGTKLPPCDKGPYPGFGGPFSKYLG